jgi:hypothetical protein
MVGFRDWVNRTEAMRAMEQLGKEVSQYRNKYGSIPPESYVDNIKKDLEGYPRFGNLKYRALWIGLDSDKDEILAYCKKKSKSFFFNDGYVVLNLGGSVRWMPAEKFESILSHQQSEMEIEMMRK